MPSPREALGWFRQGCRPQRRFSVEYKLSALEEYERLTDPGAKGALLRREGLYFPHPLRFGNSRPEPPRLPKVAWINEPTEETISTK